MMKKISKRPSDAHGNDISASKGSAAVGLMYNSVIQIINSGGGHLTEEEARQHEEQYLGRVVHDCSSLEWLAAIRYKDDNTPGVSLDSVFTALLTTTQSEIPTLASRQRSAKNESRPVSALEVLNRESRLVLTGVPGSGKSAFVNYLAVCLAGEALENPHRNLKLLTEPLPNKKGEPQHEPQRWDHGVLVPVLVILRDFAASTCFPAAGMQGETRHLLEFIEAELAQKGCKEYYKILAARMQSGKALVLFDGLDEVPQAGERRERMIECIGAFGGTYGKTHLLVTCRPYAYQKGNWRIGDFSDAALADFAPGQIRRFIDRWYDNRRQFEGATAKKRAATLKQAVLQRQSLHELVKRPLLLTLTAYLHANHHELPERRADLYERLLELLIDKWEAARFKTTDAEEARLLEQHSLAEFLEVGVDAIRLVLERLAFEAHARQSDLVGTADIPGKDLTHQLVCLATDGKDGKKRVVDSLALSKYLCDRVGILYQRGGESALDSVYTFPHRSFQEYLSAAYFRRDERSMFELFLDSGHDEWTELAGHLGRTDPDRWREVVLLAGGIKSFKEPKPVWDLLESLFPEAPETDGLAPTDAWGLRLAGEILAENLDREQLTRKRKDILQRIQQALPLLLQAECLPAAERTEAGHHLAMIGDPRKDAMELDEMPFCYVPPGPFFLGSTEADDMAGDNEKQGAGAHRLDYGYWLACFPVTVAQFRLYTEESGNMPSDADCLSGPANTPVVYVSWQEAMTFCDWLTQRWLAMDWLPAGYQFSLPSEPEWEKAARGGTHIPAASGQVVAALPKIGQRHAGLVSDGPPLEKNPMPQRRYPWGDAPDAERLNYAMNSGDISAVGAYRGGASPYGCEEMSGNVLEWTRSLYEGYPYSDAAAGCRQREGKRTGSRALRGGAFYNKLRNVRCASRSSFKPDYRRNYVGFRVVLSPLL